jgi:hypothetical protein
MATEEHVYTVREVAAMAELLVWLHSEKLLSVDSPYAWRRWTTFMHDVPHEHSQSYMGPYCYACRRYMKNGEVSATA